jgi:two-component system, NarL family, sensor kinase
MTSASSPPSRKEYVHGFSERSGIDTQLVTQIDFERLPQSLEIALFRIVQESLANIQRHSGSTTAQIRLSQLDSRLTLEVIDFGHGMTVPSNGGRQRSRISTIDDPLIKGLETRVTALGVGIPGMRERMAQLGGHLDIISGPTGTTVRATITLPLAAQTETADASSSDPHRG